MTHLDRILLTGVTLGEKYTQLLKNAEKNLPPRYSIGDLFEYPAAKEFMVSLFSTPGLLEQFQKAADVVVAGNLDAQLRSTLMEALLASEPPLEWDDFQGALSRSVSRSWARFSQQIKLAMIEAGVSKDDGLQTQLMKEYLDVQRKMKEFSNFYDEE